MAAANDFNFMESVFGWHIAPEIVRRYESKPDIRSVISEACQAKSDLTLCGANVANPVRAKFSQLRGDQIILELSQDDASKVPPRSLCTVIFTFNERQCMFFTVAQTVSCSTQNLVALLCIRIPSSIDEVEARWNERIALTPNHNLSVQIQFSESAPVYGNVADIGRGGLEAILDPLDAEALEVGNPVHIKIEFGNESMAISGELRWRIGKRFGFCFKHFHDRTVVNTPEALEALIQFLTQ